MEASAELMVLRRETTGDCEVQGWRTLSGKISVDTCVCVCVCVCVCPCLINVEGAAPSEHAASCGVRDMSAFDRRVDCRLRRPAINAHTRVEKEKRFAEPSMR
eukprot:7704-Rhodomonas_salina.1